MSITYACKFKDADDEIFAAMFQADSLSEAVHAVVAIEEAKSVQVIEIATLSAEAAKAMLERMQHDTH